MPRIAEGNRHFEEKEGTGREGEKGIEKYHVDVVNRCLYHIMCLFSLWGSLCGCEGPLCWRPEVKFNKVTGEVPLISRGEGCPVLLLNWGSVLE